MDSMLISTIANSQKKWHEIKKDVSWRQKNDKSSDFSAKSCEKEERKDKKEAWLDRLS